MNSSAASRKKALRYSSNTRALSPASRELFQASVAVALTLQSDAIDGCVMIRLANHRGMSEEAQNNHRTRTNARARGASET